MKKPEIVPPQSPETGSALTPQTAKEEAKYTAEEAAVLGRIKDIINGDFFHHVTQEPVSETNKESPSAIVVRTRSFIAKIRLDKRDAQEFFTYQDEHFDDPEYAFLKDLYPGLNVNGWRVLMAELDPKKYGIAIARKEFQVRGTISQRSAKN